MINLFLLLFKKSSISILNQSIADRSPQSFSIGEAILMGRFWLLALKQSSWFTVTAKICLLPIPKRVAASSEEDEQDRTIRKMNAKPASSNLVRNESDNWTKSALTKITLRLRVECEKAVADWPTVCSAKQERDKQFVSWRPTTAITFARGGALSYPTSWTRLLSLSFTRFHPLSIG